jgi:hypothetical protein
MNPWFVFVAVFAVLTAIRHRWFAVHRAPPRSPDHEALIRAKAALVVLAHMQTLLEAVDAELARRSAR